MSNFSKMKMKALKTHRRLVVYTQRVVLADDTSQPIHKFFEVVGNIHIGIERKWMDHGEEFGVLDRLWRFGTLDHGGGGWERKRNE